ncbi:MAG: tRNA pseudouridine(55) synthase TruB, partial [Proteobacteria bacterium]|nr:tRNA pseudouridine(55) synthase TruB [Pseudomonadota bacterium]
MNNELNGVIVIDKPANITSAKVVAIIKKLFGAGKVGHAGTLDPEATGVLLCCVNKATKLAGFFLKGSKKYEAILHLGVETDTQDATGKIISTSDGLDFT